MGVLNAVTRWLLKGGSREVQVGPSGSIDGYKASTLGAAISYAISQATAANPYTVRLLPGVYSFDASIDASSATGLRIIGGGPDSTRIVATATWVAAASAGTTASGLLNLTGASDVVVQGLYIDGGYENRPASTEVQVSPSGILLDQLAGDITISNCYIKGLSQAVFSGNTNTGRRVFVLNTRFLSLLQTVVPGAEDWFYYGSSLRAVRASTDTTTDVSTKMVVAFNPGGTTAVGSSYLSGCQLESIYTGVPANNDPFFIAPLRVGGTGLSGGRVIMSGCTLKATMLSQPTSAIELGGVSLAGLGETGWILRFSGTTFITQTGSLSIAPTSARVGVFVASELGGSFDTSNTVEVVGCDHLDVGSGGRQRGSFASILGAGSLGLIRLSGFRSPLGPALNGAETAWGGFDQNLTRGTATLSAGIKRVLLVSDAGNQSGTGTFSSSSTSVTGSGTSFTTQFAVGDFIRRSDGNDSQWTRIALITDDTHLSLEENYRGTSGSATVRRATPTQDTPYAGTAASSGNYRVLLTPTAAPGASELFYVTSKHASGFLINSSDGASTKTLDYLVVR